jgi:TolA-binding protein
MKDNKSSLLLVVSLLLLSLSLVLLAIWGYQFFNSNDKQNISLQNKTPSAAAAMNASTRDSLLDVYSKTIKKLDVRIGAANTTADSLMENVDDKITEINALKEEIRVLLKNNVSRESLNSARQKIDELQRKIEILQGRNVAIENENKELKALLQQYDTKGNAQQNTTPATPAAQPGKSPYNNRPAIAGSPTFVLTGIRVIAFSAKDDKEQETLKASETEKINGSFTVKSNGADDDADIFISVLQPNGKVLQNSDWEVGTFDTPEGRKIYSHKIHTTFGNGEEKLLHFSIGTDNLEKGNYTVLIYYHGRTIGKLVMSLS